MPWKSSSIMDERIKFVIRANCEDINFSALCRDFGITRPTGYRWLRRYQDSGSVSEMDELSRRPHHIPGRTPKYLEKRVVALRQRYGWGGKKLRQLLLVDNIDMTVTTINRILKRNGLIDREDSHRPAVKRFERSYPNELWQMDFKGDYPLKHGRCYPLSILDDHSRYALGLYALTNQDTDTVKNCIIKAFESYGVPHAMLMDHGIPWWSPSNNHGLTRLSVSLIEQGIRLYFGAFRHPQTQGKVERFHRTLNEAVRHKGRPKTLSGWRQTLRSFLNDYNNIRPHEALEMATPSEYYQPSKKAYNPHPPPWEYPEGSVVEKLNTRGWLGKSRLRYFVSEALAGKTVRIEQIDNKLIISYRHMYVREIDKTTRRTKSLLRPISLNKL